MQSLNNPTLITNILFGVGIFASTIAFMMWTHRPAAPLHTQMTTTTEDGGRTNMFAKEPPIIIMTDVTVTHNEKAEKLNGRLAMLGVIAAIGAYATTGQLIPGVF